MFSVISNQPFRFIKLCGVYMHISLLREFTNKNGPNKFSKLINGPCTCLDANEDQARAACFHLCVQGCSMF